MVVNETVGMVARLFYLTTAGLLLFPVLGTGYNHLGCFLTADPVPEVEGLKFNYQVLELGACARDCSAAGFPYMMLQKGDHCLCASAYGMTTCSICNETCQTDTIFPCGGAICEDVFYTVNTDARAVDKRVAMAHRTTLTFNDARKDCVKNNGDLLAFTESSEVDATADVAITSGLTETAWIGLYSNPWDDGNRKWTMADVIGLNPGGSSPYWEAGHIPRGLCTVLVVATRRWRSVACDELHSYICHQVPPMLLDRLTAPITTPTTETDIHMEEFWSSAKRLLAFYIVLAIFILTHIGSCVAYIGYKAWVYCRLIKTPATIYRQPEEPHDLTPRSTPSPSSGTERIREGTRLLTPSDVGIYAETNPLVLKYTNMSSAIHTEEWIGRKEDRLELLPPSRTYTGRLQAAEGITSFTEMPIADIMHIRSKLGFNSTRKQNTATSDT